MFIYLFIVFISSSNLSLIFVSRKIPFPDEGSPTSCRRENELLGSGSLQNQATPRRNSPTETQSGKNEENGAGGNDTGRGDDGRNPRIQGNVDVSFVQGEEERRRAFEMFPRVLLRLLEDTLRNEAEEVSQV